MTPKTFMVIAGEPSGDMLAADLVRAIRAESLARHTYSTDLQPLEASLAPRFFGAGGPRLAAEGAEMAFDLTSHAVTGLWEVLTNYRKFKRRFDQLFKIATDREPQAIVCVDFSGFNRRFAHAIKEHVRSRRGAFNNWDPKIIQYVSPQVWASRPGRARQMAKDFDLLLSIFPFEKEWYAARVPDFRVEFVGHPMIDRYAKKQEQKSEEITASPKPSSILHPPSSPLILMLPGSRTGELNHHLPVLRDAWPMIQKTVPGVRARMALSEERLVQQAKTFGLPADLEIRLGGLAESLAQADLAIASTGTVTMECACFGVPTVALYKTSWPTYQIGKRLVTVKYMAMPNLLANEPIFPEFIQNDATPEKISRAAVEFLRDEPRRNRTTTRLREIVASLGGPGASARAARAIIDLLPPG
jgi:lipid-A-disaccharide synthase